MSNSIKYVLSLIIAGLIIQTSLVGQTDHLDQLENEIERLEKLSGGIVGVGIHHLESGQELIYNGAQRFPMASTYKIPIAVQLLKNVEAGTLRLDSMVELSLDDANHPGSGTISRLLDDPGVSLSVLNLLELMMLISDNSATDLCIELAGGPSAINQMMRNHRIENISVDRPTHILIANYLGVDWAADRKMDIKAYEMAVEAIDGEKREHAMSNFGKDPRDQSSPSAMTQLLSMIWKGKLLNQTNSDLLLDIMYRCETGNNRIKGVLPPGTKVAHKTGTIGKTTNDVGIIDLPNGKGHVVTVVFVKDSEISIREREKAIAHISRAAYDYFLFH